MRQLVLISIHALKLNRMIQPALNDRTKEPTITMYA